MPPKRCPKCRALNAAQADACALCGRTLMGDVDEQADGPVVISTDVGRWVGPNVPPPTASRLARQAPPRRAAKLGLAPKPLPRRRPLSRTRYLLLGLAMGAFISAILVFLVGLIDQFAFRGEARSLPPIDIEGLPPFFSSVVGGAALGALVGAVVALSDNVWVGMASFTGLFIALAGWSLAGADPDFDLSSIPLILIAGAAWGAAYGYLTSAAVRAALEEFLSCPSQ